MSIVLSAVVLVPGCLGASPSGEPAATSVTVQPAMPVDTTSPTVSSSSTSSTLPADEVNRTAVCLEARANRSLYERCRKAASGELFLPQSELRRCAGIQRHAGAYSQAIYNGLQYCVGIPGDGMAGDQAENALFCKDMGQPDRDQCYLSVRMCGPIEDSDVRNRCLSGLELKEL